MSIMTSINSNNNNDELRIRMVIRRKYGSAAYAVPCGVIHYWPQCKVITILT